MIDSACNYLTSINSETCCVVSNYFSEKDKAVCIKVRDDQEAKLIKIDGCLISEGKKCDCLALFKKSKSKRFAFFVELKGGAADGSYAHAIEQILATSLNEKVIALLEKANISDSSRKAIIITGPKTLTNRPEKEEVEDALKMRLEIIKQDNGAKSFNLKNSLLIK